MIREKKLRIAVSTARVRTLHLLMATSMMAAGSSAQSAAPVIQTVSQQAAPVATTDHQPPVIRSVEQGQDRQLLGDRTTEQVATAFATHAAPAIDRPRLCAWPIVCATAPIATGKLRLDVYAAEIDAASTWWGVDPVLVRALIHAESAFNPNAQSPKGAQGLMQLMPATAARFDVTDPFDPSQNINGGVQYLAWLLNRFEGDTTLATAAYNAGEGAVDRYGGVPPYRETEQYVARVDALATRYRAALGVAANQPIAPVLTSLASTIPAP